MSDRAEELYERARSLAPEARAAFVQEVCRGDPQLRDELVALVEQADVAEEFFQLLSGAVFSPSTSTSEGENGADLLTDFGWRSPAPDLAPGDTVARYRIVSRIGDGGMGTVYRAHDTSLDRPVALKFLLPNELTPVDAEERLLVEARAAAALEHPNVCVIHEVGEAEGGRPFIAMACYEGETLKQRISRAPIPIDEAVAIAVQIARGLGAAHARGIVHRDVKPGNVMLTAGGTVKLLDFGLAKVSDVTVNRPDITPGTVAYMSPEQARGDPVDQRTDLWSLGVVLYEMLTGTRPFRGGSQRALLHAILHEDAEPISTRRTETPLPLARTVARLLQKEPDARYGSAEELLLDLAGTPPSAAGSRTRARRSALLSIAVASMVALAGALWLAERTTESTSTGAVASQESELVLVADFANLTSDSLLGDAVSQALRIDLARSPALRVAGAAAVAATLQRMRREPDARLHSELARELAVREGIRAVIDGEVREVGGGYVVSAAIVEAASGVVVDGWRETAQDRADVIPAIDRLSAAIRGRIGESLPSLQAEEPLFRSTTSSLEALRKHAHASRLFQRGEFLNAVVLYDEAIRLDSTFAQAYIGLAYALSNGGSAGVRRARALAAHAKAYELRDRLSAPEAHAVTANYYRDMVGDLPKAIEAFRNQVAAARHLGETALYASLAQAVALTGDLAAAEAVGREAREVWPTPVNQAVLAEVLYRRGKLQDAAIVLEEAMGRFPRHPLLSLTRKEMAAVSGDYAAADSLAGEMASGVGINAAHEMQALTRAVRGQIRDAIRHLRAHQKRQLAAGRPEDAADVMIGIARLMLATGDREGAIAAVEGFLVDGPMDSLDVRDRPYLHLAGFYAEAGQTRRARQFMVAYEREVPREFRGPGRWLLLQTRSAIHLAEGRPREALVDLERASREVPIRHLPFDDPLIRIDERPELARAYDRAGHADSAIVTYERYLAARSLHRTRVDAFELPSALLRLAELYQARGDRLAAARQYRRFAELWKYADRDLQPRVREARKRAAEM